MKIGHPADKPLAAPAAGAPAAPADAAKANAGVQAAAGAGRCQRDRRPFQHGVDAALGRRLGRVRRRQGRPDHRCDRRRLVQDQPRSDRRQADRQRAGAPHQGAGVMAGARGSRPLTRRSSKRACPTSRRGSSALGNALRARDPAGIDLHAAELHRALAERRQPVLRRRQERPAAAGAASPPRAAPSGQVAAQRESLARATAALDRAIDVLLPGDSLPALLRRRQRRPRPVEERRRQRLGSSRRGAVTRRSPTSAGLRPSGRPRRDRRPAGRSSRCRRREPARRLRVRRAPRSVWYMPTR